MKRTNLFLSFLLLTLWVLLSSWGETAHKKINGHAPASLPGKMSFLKTSWTILLSAHALDADDRRHYDTTEPPRHYLNIDAYPEFNSTGRIPQTFDSVVSAHGISFVLENGILPWATIDAFDSLRSCFQRKDWDKASLFAADLGHYIADAHQPMHLTENYDGQNTGQDGIHSRYETSMIDRFGDEIIYPYDSAEFITDLNRFVFEYIYADYMYIDSVLNADNAAKNTSGGTLGTKYYNALWDISGNFTIGLFSRSSHFLASLIYTAWVDAGCPVPGANDLEESPVSFSGSNFNYPNPFSGKTTIAFNIRMDNTPVRLEIFNLNGQLVNILAESIMTKGPHEITWNAEECREGIYCIILRSGAFSLTAKMLLIR